GPPLAREGDQERGERHTRGCPRIPATGRRDPDPARGPGVSARGCQPGARRPEVEARPRCEGPEDLVIPPRDLSGLGRQDVPQSKGFFRVAGSTSRTMTPGGFGRLDVDVHLLAGGQRDRRLAGQGIQRGPALVPGSSSLAHLADVLVAV